MISPLKCIGFNSKIYKIIEVPMHYNGEIINNLASKSNFVPLENELYFCFGA
jgi:hypothetical protein